MDNSDQIAYNNPLVVDIGTDSIKLNQMQNSIEDIKTLIGSKPYSDQIQEDLTPNSIFDLDIFIKSFPTSFIYSSIESTTRATNENFFDLMKLYDSRAFDKIVDKMVGDTKLESISIPDYNFTSESGNFSLSSLKFGHEKLFAGILVRDQDEDYLDKAINMIGQHHDRINFGLKLFEETPLIFTQNPHPYYALKKKNTLLIEMLFETYKAPNIMIASTSLLNVLSFNMLSGLVVDWAESSLYISPVINGFTLYDKAITVPFLAYRNCKFVNLIKDSKPSDKIIKYVNYYKESHGLKLMRQDENAEETEVRISELMAIYPEVYKMSLNFLSKTGKKNINDATTFLNNYDKQNKEEMTFMGLDATEFNSKRMSDYVNNPYNSSDLEKDILSNKLDFINNKVYNFKQLSIAHYVIYMIEKLIKDDFYNAINYLNIVLTGGGFAQKGMKERVKQEIKYMINMGKVSLEGSGYSELPKIVFQDEDMSPEKSFAKGANLLSKINNLSDLMIDRQSYFERGASNLSINYI